MMPVTERIYPGNSVTLHFKGDSNALLAYGAIDTRLHHVRRMLVEQHRMREVQDGAENHPEDNWPLLTSTSVSRAVFLR